jgi:hypothetical protein
MVFMVNNQSIAFRGHFHPASKNALKGLNLQAALFMA